MSAESDTSFIVEFEPPPAAAEEIVPAMTERDSSETDRLVGVANGHGSSPPDSDRSGGEGLFIKL